MTTLKRTFDLETRTLKSKDRCYVGQVYDHISTTLEFTYNPINALTDGMYTAYIMFDLYDDDGNIFVYGPGSSPRFDGRTFDIPTAVTSRITTQRLDYQIWLVKNHTTWNGRIEELGDTEYLFSAKDSLAFKPTTRCRSPSRDPCRPPQPCLEPGTLGWVNYLRDHCILTPIQAFHGTFEDGTEGVTLQFPTYNEEKDQALELHIPYLDSEGLIDIHTFLRVVEEYNPDVTHDQIMTALCVQNLLDEKLDKSSVIDSWKAISEGGIETPSAELAYRTFETKLDKMSVVDDWSKVDEDLDIPSAKLTKATLDEKLDDTQIIQDWGASPGKEQIPSAYLVKASLDLKVDDTQIVQTLTRTETDVPSTKLLGEGLDLKLDDTQVVQTLTRVADEIPSTKLLGEELDKKVDDTQIVQTFDVSETNIPSTKLLSDKLDEKVSQTQIAQQMSDDGSKVPSLALLQEQLDTKTDKTMAVPFWNPTEVYNSGSTVIYAASNTLEGEGAIYGGTLFISLIDNNLNNPPVYETESEVVYSEFWTMVKGSGGSTSEVKASALSFTIGNAKDTTYILSHNLGTRELILTTRDRYTDDFVYPSYRAAGFSAVAVTFHDPPSVNQFVVTVSPASGLDSSEPMFRSFTNSTTWSFTHNKNHIPMVQTYNSNRQEILGEVSFDTDAKTVIVKFNHAQTGTMVVR